MDNNDYNPQNNYDPQNNYNPQNYYNPQMTGNYQQGYQQGYQQNYQQTYQNYNQNYNQNYPANYNPYIQNNTNIPNAQNVPKGPGYGMAVASMVMGIISLVLMCFWLIGLICGVVAIGLAVAAKKYPAGNNGMATAGLATGIITVSICGIVILYYLLILGSFRLF